MLIQKIDFRIWNSDFKRLLQIINPESSIRNSEYLPSLTGVRAIAAWMVFAHHYNPWIGERGSLFLAAIVDAGYSGVTVFFVLSGFVITWKYFDTFSFTWQWFKPYLVNRIARIYPLYFVITAVTFLVKPDTAWTVAANLTLVKGFFDDLKFTGIAQGWSLTVEECFYFSAPLIFLFIKKGRFWVQPAALLAAGILLTMILAPLKLQGLFGSYSFTMVYTFFGRATEFFMGVFAALAVKSLATTASGYTKTLIGGVWILVVLLLLAYSRIHGITLADPTGIILNSILLPMGSALFFYGLVTEKTFVGRAFETRIMDHLGKGSYAFYLIHIGVVADAIESALPGTWWLFVALSASSLLVFRWIEYPLNRVIRKILLN